MIKKKIFFLCLVSAIMAIAAGVTVNTLSRQNKDSFAMNLEALARLEIVGSGTCCDSENSCMFICPGCNEKVEGLTDQLGPIKTYNCSCGYHYVKP